MNSNLMLAPGALSYRQREFVKAFTDPDKPSFLSACNSYRVISPGVTGGTARTNGHRMIHSPPVRCAVKEILERAGLSIEVRADKLAAIAHHPDIGRVVSITAKTPEGKTETLTRHGPGYKDVLKAIDLANKSDGTYEESRAASQAGEAEYRRIAARFFEGKGGRPLPRKLRAVN